MKKEEENKNETNSKKLLKIIVKYDFIALPYQNNNKQETNFNNLSTYISSINFFKLRVSKNYKTCFKSRFLFLFFEYIKLI